MDNKLCDQIKCAYLICNTIIHQNESICVFVLEIVEVLVLQTCIDDCKELGIFLQAIIAHLQLMHHFCLLQRFGSSISEERIRRKEGRSN